tara:strand:+ start:4861 stop:5799 length:939 start_codon:yes stop_codon:yes gene_type:complete
MKNFFFLFLFILLIFLLFAVLKMDELRKNDFFGKESLKKSFFYVKKKYLVNKYSNCFIDKKNQNINKQIVIAGHTYGDPGDENSSTYPKLLIHLSEKLEKEYDYLFLAGDIVKKSDKKNFLQVKEELSIFFKELYVAPGNHDVGLGLKNENYRNEFLSVFNSNFQKILINNNIFFVLDSTFDPGNISKDQLSFLKNELKNIENIRNIFVITHHVIWQNYTDDKVLSNASEDFFSNSNFEEVISLFKKLKNKTKVFFVAGDLGVFKERTVTFCEKKNNLYFIATGMGNKRLDNYLKVIISPYGEILTLKPIFY